MSRQFIPSGTMITCSIASGEVTKLVATNSTVTIYGENWLTTVDNIPNTSFKPFPSCSTKCKVPCAIIKGEWETPASNNILSNGEKLLADDSTLKCDKGGEISLIMQCVGDMTDPPNTLNKLKESLNNTFKAVVKKVETIQKAAAETIASTVGSVAAPVSGFINSDIAQNTLKAGQKHLASAQKLKNIADGHIENVNIKTEELSNYIEEEIGDREAIATDLVHDVTDNLQQELDELLNNVEDTINQNLNEIKNGINSTEDHTNQPNPYLNLWSGINHYETQLVENPSATIFTVTDKTTSNEIAQQNIAIVAPYQTTNPTERIDKLKNKLSAQTQEIRDALSEEIAKLEALIEKHSLNNYLQEKIDKELKTRIKKTEKESKELQTDMNRASTLLSGLGNEYNAFVSGLSNELISGFNSKIDPKLIVAQEKLKTTNSNLATAATGLNGAKFIAGGMPAGLVVTKAKKKKDKGNGNNIANSIGVLPLTGAGSQGNNTNTNEEDIKVTIGMFLDGTGNNLENVNDGGGYKPGDSYGNAYSNVARAYEYYSVKFNETDTKDFSIYVDGIGTTAGQEDSGLGFGTGLGITGIPARVILGTEKTVKAILSKADITKLKTVEITFDIFGFSRGAAAARHFIHENSVPYEAPKPISPNPAVTIEQNNFPHITYYNSLIDYIFNTEQYNKTGNKIEVKTIWRFAGLYETVSSYGVILDNDIPQLGLMNIDHVQKIVHFTAKDEYREKFSLTRTKGLGQEIRFHGVHSDIGGGYAKGKDGKGISEKNLILYEGEEFNNTLDDTERNKALSKVKKIRQKLIDQGWYSPDKINYVLKPRPSGSDHTPSKSRYELIASREKVKHEYSYIPLHIMTNLAITNGVNFNSQLKSKYPINDPLLKDLLNSFDGTYFNIDEATLKDIRFKYLHWSANYNKMYFAKELIYIKPHSPRLNKNKTWFEREIFSGF